MGVVGGIRLMRLDTAVESIDPCVVPVLSPQAMVSVSPDGVNGGDKKSSVVVMWQLQLNDADNEERFGQLAVASGDTTGFTEAITTSRATTCM